MRKVALRKVLFPLLSISLGLLFLVACGDTGSNTTGIPTSGGSGSGGTTPVTPDPTNPTPGLPDLSKSSAINLDDKINYSGLIAIAGNVVTPIVGDPRAVLKITNTTNLSVNGTLRLAFEDKAGFWWADMNSVEGTGVNTSSALDIIFSDNSLTIRIIAGRSGNLLISNIYYRVRQSGETQCLPVYCYVNGTPVPFGSQFCPIPKPDTAGICRNYISTTLSSVKKLGTFSASYNDVAVLTGGN